LESLGAMNLNAVGCEVVGETRKLSRKDSGFQLLGSRGVFLELHLDDLIEADRADHVGGHLRVERGRIQLGMSEQSLLGFKYQVQRLKKSVDAPCFPSAF
jgi:hypothetical protein